MAIRVFEAFAGIGAPRKALMNIGVDFQVKYTSEINELLNIEIDVYLYSISVDCFEYDDADNKYDILTPMEIMNLQRIICSKEDTNV